MDLLTWLHDLPARLLHWVESFAAELGATDGKIGAAELERVADPVAVLERRPLALPACSFDAYRGIG